MTYEEYIEKRDNLRKALRDLKNEYVNSGEIKVGDIVVDSEGNEYMVREIVVTLGKLQVWSISKRNKGGEFSKLRCSRYRAKGELRKKE